MVFVYADDTVATGNIRDISDIGACIQFGNDVPVLPESFAMHIPLLGTERVQCSRVWSSPANGAPAGYGVRFAQLVPSRQVALRKRIMLDEMIMLYHANSIAMRAANEQQQIDIRSFFLLDVRQALEALIDLDSAVPPGEQLDPDFLASVRSVMDTLLEQGDALDTSLADASLTRAIKQRVRLLLGPILYKSNGFRHAFTKPRGYPGDYEMLEMCYNNVTVSPVAAGIGRYFDRYGFDRPYSEAVRMRKDMMRDILREAINVCPDNDFRVVNLASGSIRDIREMFDFPVAPCGRATVMCIDQDEQALDFSRRQIERIDTGSVDVQLIQGNILRLEELALGEPGSIDMIYSIGIADYLQDRMLNKIFHDCMRLLRPGGRLVVAYKDRERNKPLVFNWYSDWNFIPRNEAEFIGLIEQAAGDIPISIDIVREPTGVIFFADITKLG